MHPLAKYRCDATTEGVQKVVNNIHTQGVAPLFALVDRDGRLRLCDPSQILHRQKRLKQSKDVYYIYSDENYRVWITKKLETYRM
jgi:hypothetical protein